MEKTSGEREYYLAMPYIFREDVEKVFEEEYGESLEAFDGVLIGTWKALCGFGKKAIQNLSGGIIISMYATGKAESSCTDRGLSSVTASVELHERELAQLGIRGEDDDRLRFPAGDGDGKLYPQDHRRMSEKNSGYLYLSDRRTEKFAVRNCCEYCYNIIYNSAPLFLADQADKIRSLNPGEVRLDFCTESAEEVREITGQYRRAFLEGKPVKTPETEFTRGHLSGA